jgi:hypothetical protein
VHGDKKICVCSCFITGGNRGNRETLLAFFFLFKK